MPRLPIVDVDVRPLLAQGQSPLPVILNHVNTLEPGQQLRVLAPMEPTPLYPLLAEHGLTPAATPLEDGSWSILFSPPGADNDTPAAVTTVDVRGLQPPEPMQRVLEALESLSDGEVLLALTPHRPVCLLDILEERDWIYESKQRSTDCWETRIARDTDESA